MTGISDIEIAVAKFSRQDLSTFCDWFQEFDADAWDRQTDYSAWAQRHAELLRTGRYAELDLEHLLEELSDMSRSERRELESRLLILLAHLLKWEYQYHNLSERWREFDGRSWRTTIVEQRKQLAVLLRQSPELQSVLAEAIAAIYPDAVDLASKQTRLPPETFPVHCPYRAAPLLDDDYYPGALK